MLRIWGRLSSINVRKVVLAARWLAIPFERIDAGGSFAGVHTRDYLAKNPNGLVPLIEDGDYALWESNVIVRYLCARHASGTLYPHDLQQRFDAERWMDWQQTTLNPAGRGAFIQCIRTPVDQRDHRAIEASVAATEPLLGLLDAHLARQPFLAGDRPTMADLPVACELHRWRGLPLRQLTHPHLDRWYNTFLQLPAAHGVLDLPLS